VHCTDQTTASVSFWSPLARVCKSIIAPSTRSNSLRAEIIASFHNPLFNPDLSLLDEVPSDQATHNTLAPLRSPIFSPSEFPSPSTSDSETEISQFFATPLLTPTQNSFTQSYQFPPSLPPIPTIAAMTTYTMPTRNERSAPTFDSSKPRELSRYFEDLEQLMNRAAIETEQAKKEQVLRYVDFSMEQIWKTFPAFSDNTKSYQQFKDAILVHYPDASGDFVYSIRDMDLLIGERQRVGINSTKDLSDYHLQFIAITTWLISKGQLGDLEQQRAYIRAFPSSLLTATMNRLQLKNHDHHPNVPYKVEDMYEAARFVLQGYSSFTQNLIASAGPQSPMQSQQTTNPKSPQTPSPPVKAEDRSAP
jgi:hypothetical protein